MALDLFVPKLKGTRSQVPFWYLLIEVNEPVCNNAGMATLDSDDLKAIENLIEVKVDEVIERRQLVTKEDLSHLPTKDDFYEKMDEVVGELKASREEQAVLGHQVSDHGERIGRIESRVAISSD